MDNVREWESVEHSILNRMSLLSHFLQGSEINKQKKSIMKSQKMEIEGERENKRQKDEGGDEKKASRLDQLFWFLQTSLHSSDICNCIKSVMRLSPAAWMERPCLKKKKVERKFLRLVMEFGSRGVLSYVYFYLLLAWGATTRLKLQ